nr:DNA-directed RNA polymerase II subunit RPB1-like [Procambarus clarkii]XP_045620982.1 DNA-directed RNA polymerase II subunit RPB1-like [Procambarus clarkii]
MSPGYMSPYSPNLTNGASYSLSHSSSNYHPTSLTVTSPPLPPGYSPSNYSLHHSQIQGSSPVYSSNFPTAQAHSAISPPDYHPTWIPRAPTPPRYSPTSPTYTTFAPLEYSPNCPSYSFSSSSEPASPPIYQPSWIPRGNQTTSESTTNKLPSTRDEYVPTQPSPEIMASYSSTSPPPYRPTYIHNGAQALPEYVPSPTNSVCSLGSDESSLAYTPELPHYRPTSPCIQLSSSYSSKFPSFQTCHSYVPSSKLGFLPDTAGSCATSPNTPPPPPSYSPASSVCSSTSLRYSPSSLPYTPITLSPPRHTVSSASYSPSSPGYS